MPSRLRRSARCIPMKPAAPVTRTFMRWLLRASLGALRTLERAQLGVLAEARECADGDVHEPGAAVEKSRAQYVEADEARQWREHEARGRRAHAPSVHGLRLERRVSVLLGEIPVERFGRSVQQIAV